jgi:hypothetical protein
VTTIEFSQDELNALIGVFSKRQSTSRADALLRISGLRKLINACTSLSALERDVFNITLDATEKLLNVGSEKWN